jgi:hypothetical protein
MRRLIWLTGFVLAAPVTAADKETVVEIDGLKSAAPADWKAEKPSSNLRVAQFAVPGPGGPADLGIFKAGGGAKANIDRWKAQFRAPDGKDLDVKVEEIKIADRKATYVDLSGTYNPPPFDPKFKGEPRPNFRLLAIYLDGKNDAYQIKLLGPAKTVDAQKKAFDEWLKAFK